MGILLKSLSKKAAQAAEEALAKKSARAAELEGKAAEAYAQMPEYLQDPYLGLSTSNIGKVTKSLLNKVPSATKNVERTEILVPPRKELESKLERAKPFTDEELRAFAERMAPQVNNEFYKPNPKVSQNPVGMSYSRWKAEQDLKHTIEKTRDVPAPIPYDPAKWEGHVLSSIVGDPTIGDKVIVDINGRKLYSPSKQEAGSLYGLGEPTDAWASTPTAAKAIQGRMIDTSNRYNAPVLGVYTKMGPDSYSFAYHVEDALLKNIVSNMDNMTDKQINTFNKLIRNHTPEFAGIENPNRALEQLKDDPKLRAKFYDVATKQGNIKTLGIPNGLDAVHAALEPELRYLETGATGHSVIQMDPSQTILLPAEHTTYHNRIPRLEGTEIMQSEAPIPYQLQYPDQLLAISKNPKQANQPFGTISMGGASQINDAQHVDQISKYLEYLRKLTGKATGGLAHMAGGGIAKAIGKKVSEAAAEKIAKKTEYELAHELAQKNAVEMLGLHPENTAKDRARALGFDVDNPVYHGTTSDIREIDPNKFGSSTDTYSGGSGFWSSDDPHTASTYADYAAYYKPVNKNPKLFHIPGHKVKENLPNRRQNIIPMYIKKDDMLSVDQKGLSWDELMDNPKLDNEFNSILDIVNSGKASVGEIKNFIDTAAGIPGKPATHYMSPNPSAYRSVHAAFDPAEAESADLLKARGGLAHMADGGEVLKEQPRGSISGAIADILKPASDFLGQYEVKDYVPILGGTDLADLTSIKGAQSLAEDISRGYSPVHGGSVQTATFDPRLIDAASLLPGVGPLIKGAKSIGRTAVEQAAKNIAEDRLIPGLMVNPRHNIIKDPGGMLVGGEKALDDELSYMKKPERFYTRTTTDGVTNEVVEEQPNSVALNNWINTKVRKYLRNQAGSENDPILKAIESGVEHNFTPALGDTKYAVKNKRALVGKPEEGIAKTDLGKEWEYKVDSIFNPKSSKEIKDILNSPMEHVPEEQRKRRMASLLRVEQDLPITYDKDLEALKLINEIPDKNVYTLSGTNITERLGLKHVSDVLHEDLQSGRLKPEQLDQMSIEKAVRRAAEYDAQKAREMEKAHATSTEGMPVPKVYDDGFKWVELKHGTDPEKTKGALSSEGKMMGHCVGSYCHDVLHGDTGIYSLRGPDNKSHVTIEVSKNKHLGDWLNANKEEINKDPLLRQIADAEPDMENYLSREEDDAARISNITKLLRKKGAPVHEAPNQWLDIIQVKGKQNKRPDEKYQKYVSDFITNHVPGHEIVDVHELENTNLHDVQSLISSGLASKELHFHPDVLRALNRTVPNYSQQTPLLKDEYTYGLIKEIAKDLSRNGKYFVSDEDILNAIRDKHLKQPTPGHKNGGVIQLKIPSLRRKYG